MFDKLQDPAYFMFKFRHKPETYCSLDIGFGDISSSIPRLQHTLPVVSWEQAFLEISNELHNKKSLINIKLGSLKCASCSKWKVYIPKSYSFWVPLEDATFDVWQGGIHNNWIFNSRRWMENHQEDRTGPKHWIFDFLFIYTSKGTQKE